MLNPASATNQGVTRACGSWCLSLCRGQARPVARRGCNRVGSTGVVTDEVWQRIEQTVLEVAALARELAGSAKEERS